MYINLIIVSVVFIIRLAFLKISKKNEQQILKDGGEEYGKANSKRLTILHILFYVGCFSEAIIRQTPFDKLSFIGLCLLIFSIYMLAVVVHLLDGIWTIKLMVAKNHTYNNHWLFETIRHPNYFLNILPELIGLALVCHAWITLCIISPLYCYVMFIRIKQENIVLETIIRPNKQAR